MFCAQCGNQVPDVAVMCTKCGVPTGVTAASRGVIAKSRVAYVLLGIFLGGLGIHNFYAGYAGRGIAQLLLTVLTGWLIFPLIAIWIWVIVEVCTVNRDAQGVPFS